MTNINLIRKSIVVDENNMNIVIDQHGYNTLAFLADFSDIPKNALVTSVIVNGKHLKRASNLAEKVEVEYPRFELYEDKRVVAALHSEYDGNPLVDAARALAIKSFVVEYLETAIAEV